MATNNQGNVTAAGFPQQGGGGDESSAGLQYQHYMTGLDATGWNLGKGRRVAPSADALFTRAPVSGAQFGGGGSPKSSFAGAPDEED